MDIENQENKLSESIDGQLELVSGPDGVILGGLVWRTNVVKFHLFFFVDFIKINELIC